MNIADQIERAKREIASWPRWMQDAARQASANMEPSMDTAALSRYANPGADLGHAGPSAPVHADPRLELVTVQLSLPSDQALALAQFVKRCTWGDMRTHSIDDDEAYRMRDAIEKLRSALALAGYAPR